MNSCIKLKTESASLKVSVKSLNQQFGSITAKQRIDLASKELAGNLAMTSSFGIHAAVGLHLITQVMPDIPVILIDTGYLFKETYQYAEQLRAKLKLNLHIFQSEVSAARFESLHGQLWLDGIKGLNQYNQIRKVAPLEKALQTLNIDTWFSGIRRNQSTHRMGLPWIEQKNGRNKVHPMLDWTDRDLFYYLNEHQLPQHPLYEKGYLTVGDSHSTQSIHEVNQLDELRFFGLKRECGIHE
jgi:phosphoadenosine phosphosulfate reductase